MRIVAAPDGHVTRKDRAIWLTPPFDRAFQGAASEAVRIRWFPGLTGRLPGATAAPRPFRAPARGR